MNGGQLIDGATARLRDDDIDRGRTGDKVDWPDPSAAPLGTDDEAGGSPASNPAVEDSRRRYGAPQSPAKAQWARRDMDTGLCNFN
jgi:hypothetical protein